MVQLLILSDDFTGALDTGVQFASRGAATYVVNDPAIEPLLANDGLQVLVVNTETRHLPPAEAYGKVYDIARKAAAVNIRHIYKKTDSALRGNPGAELAAVHDAFGGGTLHFVPAYPAMGRVTRGGVHYVDGRPVAESDFGQDLYEPVQSSTVADILRAGCDAHISLAGGSGEQRGICIHDAETDGALGAIAHSLREKGGLRLTGGCAGFAAALAQALGLRKEGAEQERLPGKGLVVLCGSLHPVSLAQCAHAEAAGAPRFRLAPHQKLEPGWATCAWAKAKAKEIAEQTQAHPLVLLDSSDPDGKATLALAQERNMPLAEVRTRVIDTMGALAKNLLEEGLAAIPFFMGGDLLQGFMRHVGADALVPLCEVRPGVVLSRLALDGTEYPILSKSGGFGEEDLFTRLAEELAKPMEVQECAIH